MNQNKKLWWGLILLILLSPLGSFSPRSSGPVQPGRMELGGNRKNARFHPEGLKKWTDLWSSPLPEYNVAAWEKKGLFHSSLGYILSGFLGLVQWWRLPSFWES